MSDFEHVVSCSDGLLDKDPDCVCVCVCTERKEVCLCSTTFVYIRQLPASSNVTAYLARLLLKKKKKKGRKLESATSRPQWLLLDCHTVILRCSFAVSAPRDDGDCVFFGGIYFL